MLKYFLLTCGLLACCCLQAQPAKTLDAFFQTSTPVIDGSLADSCWQNLAPIGPFQTHLPVFGLNPKGQTEVRLFYTETALYLAADCLLPAGGRIRDDGGIRDGDRTGDWLQISLDTWNDDRLRFDFTVTAAGVQSDARMRQQWDALWQSAVIRHARGWSVEICIPFSALRYPKKTVQDWGLQVTRYDVGSGETSTWSPQDPLVSDQVIQFGLLRGLTGIRQGKRRSLALHAGAESLYRYKDHAFAYLLETAGLDGKIGLNESATLDVTLFPRRYGVHNFPSISAPPRFFYNDDVTLPEPRQFVAEEADLFGKNDNLNFEPYVGADWMLWRLDDGNGTPVYLQGTSNSKVLQASKLSARTRGNWRFGVFNALLGPVKANILTDNPITEVETKTLQVLSNYNYLTTERILPNNSYINISTSTLLAGEKYTSLQPGLNFQLRDRSNSYEVQGSTDWSYHRRADDTFAGFHYWLRLSRINRRWGWSVLHQQQYTSLTRPEWQANSAPGTVSRAQLNYRSFQPRGRILQRFGDAGLQLLRNPNNTLLPQTWLLSGNLRALDRQFQTWSVHLNSIPHERKQRYSLLGAHIDRVISPNVGGHLSFASDLRKRLRWDALVFGATGLKGEIPRIGLTLTQLWVLRSSLALQVQAQWQNSFDNLELIGGGGSWIFERYQQRNAQGRLTLHWYPVQPLRLSGSFVVQGMTKTNREAVELQDNRQLTPVDQPLPEFSGLTRNAFAVDLEYVFSGISRLRFQYAHDPKDYTVFTGAGIVQEQYPEGKLNLSLIWFVDGSRIR